MSKSDRKGPTDRAIRTFHDTFNEKKRYKKTEKRYRKFAKQEIEKQALEDQEDTELEDIPIPDETDEFDY